MTDNTLARLHAAGIDPGSATDAQRQVLAALTDDELSVLTSVKERLTAAGAEVEAHRPPDTIGYVVF